MRHFKQFLALALLVALVLFGGSANMLINRAEATDTAAEYADGVCVPVLMYHHMLKDESRVGDYVITPAMFEQDLQELKKRGYTAISASELIAFAKGRGSLPKKPIMISFDDGYETFYAYAFPLLKKYGIKSNLNIIGAYTDLYSGDVQKGLSYSHTSWQELKELSTSGLVEIGNHSYDMHSLSSRKGILRLQSESQKQYERILAADLNRFNDRCLKELGFVPRIFAYPFGAIPKNPGTVLKDLDFELFLTCEEKVCAVCRGDAPVILGRFNRAGSYSSKKIFDKLE